MVIAPATGFGDFSGALLVGNFGDGKINAFNATTGVQLGTLSQSPGRPLVIDGLWGLHFGNGTAGTTTSLYYAAGPDNETHGLFGKITANPEGTNPVTAVLTNGNLNITGSRDNDFVIVNLVQNKQTIKVHAGGEVIGTFAASSVMSIEFHGFSGHDVFVVHPLITAPTLADGGADNDVIVDGGGNDIILGNAGNDVLVGRKGNDILIGGIGRDVLVGAGGEDLLIGGSTTYDTNAAMLKQIQTAWISTAPFATRVANLRAGAGGVPKLDATTVLDDGVRDTLVGGPGLDWFFATGADHVAGKKKAGALN
jgi:Ca2+-binding RTX toxin-like protein